MPTYEYLCTACGHEWEFEQSIKEDPLKVCQKCSQETARRQISRGTGFILKGGGWYSDLYSSSSNKPKESKPEGGGDKGGGDKGGSDGGSSTPSSGETKSGGTDSGTSASSTPKTPSSPAAA